MCKWIDEETEWCRHQTYLMRQDMDLNKALEIADFCEDEGIVSTTGVALRTIARAYRDVKMELDVIEYERTKHIPQLLKGG